MGPLLSTSQWNDALKRCGFDGLRIALPDGPEETHGLTLIVSSVSCPESVQRTSHTVILQETYEQNSLATSIQAHLDPRSDGLCEIMSTNAFAKADREYDQCICLWELGQPILDRLTNAQFASLQRMVATSKEILWINDSCGEAAEKPEAAMVAGFAKTLARERPNLSFVHFNVEQGSSTEANILRLIDHRRKTDPRQHETDLLEQRGEICIPRAVEAPHVNCLFDSEIHQSKIETVDSETVRDHLKLAFSPGQLSSFRFVVDDSIASELLPDEVEVRVKATGLNFKDVLVALNRVHAHNIGQEFAGEVTRVGSALEQTFQPGDRVCGLAPGTFQTYIRTRRSCIMKVPSSMSYTEAAASPLAYATAQYALAHLARLEVGETILIHAAAGGVGQAAIQIAQDRHAKVLVTVGTQDKKQLLIDQYGIDPADIFSSRHLTFSQEVMERTGGKGVDVVLNSLSGRALMETWRCMAPLGRFIEIGKRDIDEFRSLPMSPFQRNISFSSVDIDMILRHKESLMRQLMDEVEQLVLTETSRKLTAPRPLTIFKRSGFEEALRLIQTGQHIGKVVIDWEEPDTIQASSSAQTS
jgi:NADPH:quinone reductase-like Zn-dependent oxidoreductase